MTDKGVLTLIDDNGDEHIIHDETTAEMVIYDNNGTDTTVADFLSNISANTAEYADVAEKAEKDSAGNVITTTYALKNSPTFTGTPTAPTASDLDLLTNQVATVAWCNNVFKRFTGIVPENMDTLQEFWDALGQDSDLATTIATELATKQDKTDKLTAFSNLTLSADQLILATGANSFSTTTLTSTGKSLISQMTDKDIRRALGVYKNLVYDECEKSWEPNGTLTVANGEIVFDGSSFTRNLEKITLGGANPFTVEFIIKAGESTDSSTNKAIVAFYCDMDYRFLVGSMDNKPRLFWKYNANTIIGVNADKNIYTDYSHFAISYDGTTIKYFVDGELIHTLTQTLDTKDYRIFLGGTFDGSQVATTKCSVAEFKMSKACEYTADFSDNVPTRLTEDANTVHLLHFD